MLPKSLMLICYSLHAVGVTLWEAGILTNMLQSDEA